MIFLLFAVTIISFSSCATAFHGKEQKVTIQSDPPGAIAAVDGKEIGPTPVVVTLPRKQDHVVTVSKEGYQEEDAHVKRKLSALALLYLLPGGTLSLGADAIHGAQFSFQDEVVVKLHPNNSPKGLMSKQLRLCKAVTSSLVNLNKFNVKNKSSVRGNNTTGTTASVA